MDTLQLIHVTTASTDDAVNTASRDAIRVAPFEALRISARDTPRDITRGSTMSEANEAIYRETCATTWAAIRFQTGRSNITDL